MPKQSYVCPCHSWRGISSRSCSIVLPATLSWGQVPQIRLLVFPTQIAGWWVLQVFHGIHFPNNGPNKRCAQCSKWIILCLVLISVIWLFRTFVSPVRVSKYACTKPCTKKKDTYSYTSQKMPQYVSKIVNMYQKKWYMTPVYHNNIILIHAATCIKTNMKSDLNGCHSLRKFARGARFLRFFLRWKVLRWKYWICFCVEGFYAPTTPGTPNSGM